MCEGEKGKAIGVFETLGKKMVEPMYAPRTVWNQQQKMNNDERVAEFRKKGANRVQKQNKKKNSDLGGDDKRKRAEGDKVRLGSEGP